MKSVKVYSQVYLAGLTKKRSNETKVGEKIHSFSEKWKDELKVSAAQFIIIGIPEDIGVRANYGRPGAYSAYVPALESFLSQQSNSFLGGTEVGVLGEINCEDLMERSKKIEGRSKTDIQQLRDLVAELDSRVVSVISTIIKSGKIPLIIGGGHNNAYGNISGSFSALKKKINVINCDAHLDFRPCEGRHSGNGFSYAWKEGFINRYAALAIHEQYNNSESLDHFKKNPDELFYNTYESIFIREEDTFTDAMKNAIGFVKDEKCGVEIDLDAITNVPSSAKTSSGISPVQARQYMHACASNLKVLYLHIAEGAPVLAHIKADNKTGKLIAYLVSDFIKGVMSS